MDINVIKATDMTAFLNIKPAIIVYFLHKRPQMYKITVKWHLLQHLQFVVFVAFCCAPTIKRFCVDIIDLANKQHSRVDKLLLSSSHYPLQQRKVMMRNAAGLI
jgi:hypothetical protein